MRGVVVLEVEMDSESGDPFGPISQGLGPALRDRSDVVAVYIAIGSSADEALAVFKPDPKETP